MSTDTAPVAQLRWQAIGGRETMAEINRQLEERGVKLSDGPTKSTSGMVFAFIDAPDGYEIELTRRSKP